MLKHNTFLHNSLSTVQDVLKRGKAMLIFSSMLTHKYNHVHHNSPSKNRLGMGGSGRAMHHTNTQTQSTSSKTHFLKLKVG